MFRQVFRVALLSATVAALPAQSPLQPDMARIPEGEFRMGSEQGDPWEKPVHTVRAPAFEIGVRPVSNAEFRAFRPSHESPGDKADSAPATGVTWHDAERYCRWLSEQTGKSFSLPSEAYWERAARGGVDQVDYPWGEEPLAGAEPRANAFGVYAVSYNLWEWVEDWYQADYYSSAPEDDPRGPAEGVFKVLRGGGFRDDPASAKVYTRGSARPGTAAPFVTFRVASSGGPPAPQPTVSELRPPVSAPPPPPATRPISNPAPPAAKPSPVAKPAPVVRTPTPKPKPPPAAAAPAPSPLAGPLTIRAVKAAAEGGEVVVRIAASGRPAHKSFALDNPDRLVVDIPEARLDLSPPAGAVKVGSAGVQRVRYSQFQVSPPVVRIVIDLDAAPQQTISAGAAELTIRVKAQGS